MPQIYTHTDVERALREAQTRIHATVMPQLNIALLELQEVVNLMNDQRATLPRKARRWMHPATLAARTLENQMFSTWRKGSGMGFFLDYLDSITAYVQPDYTVLKYTVRNILLRLQAPHVDVAAPLILSMAMAHLAQLTLQEIVKQAEGASLRQVDCIYNIPQLIRAEDNILEEIIQQKHDTLFSDPQLYQAMQILVQRIIDYTNTPECYQKAAQLNPDYIEQVKERHLA